MPTRSTTQLSLRLLPFTLVVCLVVAAASLVAQPAAAASPALGDSTIEGTPDGSGIGTAEANQFVATASTSVDALLIYVDSSNASTRLQLGLYSDAAGVPGTLLASGTLAAIQNGAWNTVTIAARSLTSGQPYWIARLSLAGGNLITRVDPNVANPDRDDSRNSTALPATFSPAGSWPHRTSMYATTIGAPSASPTTTPSATPTPTPSPTSTAAPAAGGASGFAGSTSVEPSADSSALGQTEANRFVAASSGPVSSISIYLDAASAATRIALGLYDDSNGAPGSLLAQGSNGAPSSGAWNSVGIATVTLSAGTPYWIARLSQAGGALVTRVNDSVALADYTDSRTSATLPSSFSPAGSYPHRTSMYAGVAAGATPPPSATPPPPTPSPTPSAGTRTCMEVIGFSQTMQWYYGGPTGWDQFLSQMPPGGTQLRWQGGASIDAWADPAFVGWSSGIQSGACSAGSSNPDRIVMNISGGFNSDVSWWHDQTAQAVANARRIYPGIRTVYLQPVVGGPNHGACFVGGNQVRATYNEPYISQAITRLVSEGVGVTGANPLVHSCGDYADDTGHLTDSGRVNAATDVGGFYSGR